MRSKFLSLCALVLLAGTARAQPFNPTTSPNSPDGVKAVIDLPTARHIKNVGGSDGAGLCVFTSVQHSADWQNVRTLDGFREWMRRRPGGGWPQKLDEMLAQFCRERGVSVPQYIQHTGGDESFLELALQTDRFPAVTYAGMDDFYRDRFNRPAQIAHMVNVAHLDDKWAAIIDNNRPGVWVWMSRRDFLTRWRANDGGWAVVLLDAPPPPHRAASFMAKPPCVCGDDCKCEAGACSGKCPTVFGQHCANGRCGVPVVNPPVYGPGNSAALPAPATTNGPEPVGQPPSDQHEWRQFPNGVWGWRFKEVAQVQAVADNFGVDTKRIHSHPTYSLNGQEVTKARALAAIGAGGLVDDRDRWHLTCVGDADLARRVKADLEAVAADLKGKLHVQAYSPNDWPVETFGLPRGVSLRKPSPVRSAAEVGVIAPEEYTAAKLTGLFAAPGGPNYKTPAPAPTPKPNDPLEPAPKPANPEPPAPAPAPVKPPVDLTGVLALAVALLAIWLTSRK